MSSDEATPAPAPPDAELLLAEIYEEVERRRASGELPGELERELDRAFAELAPPGAVGEGSALVLERVQRTSFIEPRVPLEHLRPPISLIKRALFKLMAWYVHFVTDQVSAFGGAVVAALRDHDRRLGTLEEGGPAVPARLRAELDRGEDPAVPGPLADAVVEALAGERGRVLVAEAGDAELLRALRRAGSDAYGAEPRRSRLPAALREGLEIRPAGALEHLRALPAGRLAAVVLAGAAVERGQPAAYAELVDQAARVVRPGGTVVVVSQSLEAWLAGGGGPVADLAPGRPLRAATWAHLLARAGLDVGPAVHAEAPRPVSPVDPSTPGAEQLNELIARVTPLVAPPPAYLVRAHRRS